MKDRVIAMGKQFLSFGMVGAINTLLSLMIYWVCVKMDIHYLIANTVSFVITVAISYVLNNIFTFKDAENKRSWSFRTLLKVYVSYFLTGMFLNSILLWFWNDFIGINKNLSPVLNLFVTIPLNFILNKLWAYKKKEEF